MTHKPFTAMLAEIDSYMGDRMKMPRDTNDIDDMEDKDHNNEFEGGMELPKDKADQVADLDDDSLDLSEISIDQIIAALLAIKAKMSGATDTSVTVDDDNMEDPMSGMQDDDTDISVNSEQDTNPLAGLDDDDNDEGNNQNPFSGQKKNSQYDLDVAGGPTLDQNDSGDFSDLVDPSNLGPDDIDELGNPVEPEPTDSDEPDPDRMGTIRTVKGAHLVYKRQNSDGTFSELWIYNIGDHVNDAIAIKKAIVAGTDIPDGKLRTEDGSQTYDLTTMGNAQLLRIDGLPS